MADAYFREKNFKMRYAKRKKSVRRMLNHLSAPDFDFDRAGWNNFYQEGVLGKLNELARDRVFQSGGRLREALRELVRTPSTLLEDIPTPWFRFALSLLQFNWAEEQLKDTGRCNSVLRGAADINIL